MAIPSLNFTDVELQYMRQALANQVSVLRRTRSKHISGSAMFNAVSEEIVAVQSVLTKIGG